MIIKPQRFSTILMLTPSLKTFCLISDPLTDIMWK